MPNEIKGVKYSKTNRRGKTKEISASKFYKKRDRYSGGTTMSGSNTSKSVSFTTKKKTNPKSKSVTVTFNKAKRGGTVKK